MTQIGLLIMNLEHFEQRMLNNERELAAINSRLAGESGASGEAKGTSFTGAATCAENTAESRQERL